MTSANVHLAPMRRRHLPGVLRIEGRAYSRPWSLAIFLSEIAMVESRYYYVALEGRRVVGYCGLMVLVGEGHITNIAVDPSREGEGIATRLLLNAFEVGRKVGAKDMTLEVRASNIRAQKLYFSFGFEPVGVRKNYYQETREDAIIMWSYDINSDASIRRTEAISRRIFGDRTTNARPSIDQNESQDDGGNGYGDQGS